MSGAHWRRVLRGMFGTSLAFGIASGAATFAIGATIMTINGTWDPIDLMRVAGRFGVVGCILGVLFSGALAAASRWGFRKLTLPRFGLFGAAAGFLYFLFIGFANGFRVWTTDLLILNLTLLLVIGAVAAMAILFVAQRATGALGGADDEPAALGEGDDGGASVFTKDRARERQE